MAIAKYFADLPARLAEFGKDMFDSYLDVPDGEHPELNASLTLMLRVRLNFVDGTNVVPGVIAPDGEGFSARDSGGLTYKVCNWEAASRREFQERFLATQQNWDDRFVLITPKNYDGLDYDRMIGQGWHVRPNVVCLFRLSVDDPNYHRLIHVVRLETMVRESTSLAFGTPRCRANSSLYASHSPERTLNHEIGHALNQSNILGVGPALTFVNAVSWLERIAQHTGTDADAWETRMEPTPPRKVPLGVIEVGGLARG